MRIVLASKSPRRRALLNMLGLTEFIVRPAVGPETAEEHLPPEARVEYIALEKAREVAAQFSENTVVIAADTLVYLGGVFLGKPGSPEEAASMLRRLSGRKHRVYTGLAVIGPGRELTGAEMTEVSFRDLTDREISRYVETGEPLDKAGAYGAQGAAALFIERIEGDYFNVVGLPLCRLGGMLEAFGILLP